MSVHDVPGYTQIPSVLANSSSLEIGIDRHRGMGDIAALFDNDLLRTVDMENILYELFGVVRIFDDLDTLPGHIAQFYNVISLLSDSDIALSFLHHEDELVVSLQTIHRIGMGEGLEQCDVAKGILRQYDIYGHTSHSVKMLDVPLSMMARAETEKGFPQRAPSSMLFPS